MIDTVAAGRLLSVRAHMNGVRIWSVVVVRLVVVRLVIVIRLVAVRLVVVIRLGTATNPPARSFPAEHPGPQ